MSERSSARAYSDSAAARVTARQVAMWELRRKTGLWLGNTAVGQGRGRVTQRFGSDPAFSRRVTEILKSKGKT